MLKKILVALWEVARHPINRHARVAAVLRYGVVQVAARLTPGDVCVPFPNQTVVLVSPRMKGAAHFIAPGLCEFDVMSFVMHFLRPGDLFVDVGANVGAYTILASGVAGAKSIAFEPSPTTFWYLSRNVKLNNLEKLAEPFNLALGKEQGVMHLTERLGTENYVLSQAAPGQTTPVGVAALDQMLESRQPVLLKIDVEGFESQVLAGAPRTLAQPSLQAFIIERMGNANRYGEDEAIMHEQIRALGFIPCAYTALERALVQLGPNETGNLIYVRDFDAVQKKVREAAPYRFAGLSV